MGRSTRIKSSQVKWEGHGKEHAEDADWRLRMRNDGEIRSLRESHICDLPRARRGVAMVAMVAMVGLSAAAAVVVVVVVVVVVIRAAGEAATRCTMEDRHRVDANGRSEVGLVRSEQVRRQSRRVEWVRGQRMGSRRWMHGRVHGMRGV